MTSVVKTVLVEHSSKQMFDLVDQVEHYPEFLPWCDKTTIIAREDNALTASIHINFHHLQHAFTTHNTYTSHSDHPHKDIHIRLVEGPFKSLEGCWIFLPLGDKACKIQFELHYEFSSKILEKLVGGLFQKIATSMVDAFIKRADKVHA